MYPSDWVLMPATNNQRWTQILSWTPVGPGGMDGVPTGGLLVRISITSDSVPSNGEPIEVGDKGYAGVLVHGDKTETNPFWNPELVRRVYYQAQDSQWLIEGFFGNEVNDSNPNLPMFLRIVKSIAHVNVPAPRHTPISQPTPTPNPLSPAYLNPRGALILTLEQHGEVVNSADTITKYWLDLAPAFQGMYNVATADVGYFNTDTSDFKDWLTTIVDMIYGTSPQSQQDLHDIQQHMLAQIRIALNDPQSDIGHRLRVIEAGYDPVFPGHGPVVYWNYLLGAYGGLTYGPGTLAGMSNGFQSLVDQYEAEQLSASPPPDFGTFLANSEFADIFFPQSKSP